jgi:hypothetical protein
MMIITQNHPATPKRKNYSLVPGVHLGNAMPPKMSFVGVIMALSTIASGNTPPQYNCAHKCDLGTRESEMNDASYNP